MVGRPKKGFLQSDIELAIRHTKSNTEAARFLNVSLDTYRKYAKMYYDVDGNNLYDSHSNKSGKGIAKFRIGAKNNKIALQEIISGNRPNIHMQHYRDILIHEGIIDAKCEICGFSEKRIFDNKYPLLLNRITDDRTDFRLENMQLLCYNCFFLTVGNIVGARKSITYEK